MSETNQDDPKSEAVDDATDANPIWRNVRVIGTAAACLLVFSLATYLMKAMTAGANVTVEADELTTVLMNADGLRLEEIDGPLVLTLRPGNNAVRAGRFRVVGEIVDRYNESVSEGAA